jgi:hypothetical protein
MQGKGGSERMAWMLWERWISEILADFWSLARVGIAATSGLIGVVSLPRPFVFRLNVDDPHPVPWMRVMLSCAMGEALFPHPQWKRLSAAWQAFYPLQGLDGERSAVISSLLATMPSFIALLINHRPPSLRGKSLGEVLRVADRQPLRLGAIWQHWRNEPRLMRTAAPSLVFAVIGQARADNQITPEQESATLGELLSHWALVSTFSTTASPTSAAHEPPAGNCNCALCVAARKRPVRQRSRPARYAIARV